MANILSDLKLAVELEKKGYDFYAQSAAKTKVPLLSATFDGLASRELVHIKAIKKIAEKLNVEKEPKGDWLRGIFVPVQKKDLLKPIIEKLKENIEKKVETGKDITEIYETAKGFEKDSVALYERLSSEALELDLRNFFAALAIEENEHFVILDETLQYLNNPGEWFKEQERWIVEGG